MQLAGIPIRDELVLEFARLVDDDELAGRLEDCYGRDVRLLGLTIAGSRIRAAPSHMNAIDTTMKAMMYVSYQRQMLPRLGGRR